MGSCNRRAIHLAIAVTLWLASFVSAAPSELLSADSAAKDSLSTRCRGWLRARMVREVDLSCYGIMLDDD